MGVVIWRPIMLDRRSSQVLAGAATGKARENLNVVAIYAALMLIAAIVFGTLSYRPF
jgi:hypothetical protein